MWPRWFRKRALVALALAFVTIVGCRRDGPNANPTPDSQGPVVVAPRPDASDAPAAASDGGGSERARWFGPTNYAHGLPALRSACAPDGETTDHATAEHPGNRVTFCKGGKVAAVSIGFLDAGPAPPPDWYLGSFKVVAGPRDLTDKRLFVAPSELLLSSVRRTRRLTGMAIHVALDLEDEHALGTHARTLGLVDVAPIREGSAWLRSLRLQRGAGLGLLATITAIPDKSAGDVRLTIVNRDTVPNKLAEFPMRAPSLALDVWSMGARVSPGPPPTPPASMGEITLAPRESKTYDHRLAAYSTRLHGPVVVAPKVDDDSLSVEVLRMTVP